MNLYLITKKILQLYSKWPKTKQPKNITVPTLKRLSCAQLIRKLKNKNNVPKEYKCQEPERSEL